MSDQVVLYEVNDGVALLTLNRPHRLNAWTAAMEKGYFDHLEAAAADPDVKIIVLTGAGRGFCAGADMDALQGIGDSGGSYPDRDERPRPVDFAVTIPKPIIAAVNGPCAGIGLAHAVLCDLRFAAAGAKFTTSFARRGLVAEHGLSWTLPQLVGQATAMDLLFSGRVFLAEEAHALGLVNRVAAPEALLDETMAYARDVAVNCSPASLAVMKKQVYRHAATDLRTAITESYDWMRESLRQPDFKEGVASFVEKRLPHFAPLSAKPGDGA